MSIRQAVLIVGGSGTRLWPLTHTMPKPLLPVAGVPFVQHQIDALRTAGIDRIALAVGAGDVDRWTPFARKVDAELFVEEQPLDTAGGIRANVDALDDRFLALNGDVMFQTPIASFLDGLPEVDGVLALVEVEDPSAYGVVVTDEFGAVSRFVEKPPPGTAPANTVSAGMYALTKAAIAAHPLGRLSFERTIFPDLADRGRLAGRVVHGRWLDIGLPELYIETNGVMLGRHVADATADVRGELAGEWSYCGPRSTVETAARVDESIVLDDATIGEHVHLRRSVIGWGASIGSHVHLRDVVVGEGAKIADGAIVPPGSRIGPDETWSDLAGEDRT
ncbi:MAG: NDP-sugar synthase [Acidimicrobiia bacterium]|nr:NDP-sugar synthase [Acidimicrobiia bacterium]NNF64254.1 NDP-sugar synthase [Acidimicrobiia bacterium]